MTPRQADLQRDGLRRALAGALADIKGGDPAEIATNRWGSGRPPPMIEQRAGISGMVSGDASPFRDESLAFFESVSADSVVGRDAFAPRSIWRAPCQRLDRRDGIVGRRVVSQADQPDGTAARQA